MQVSRTDRRDALEGTYTRLRSAQVRRELGSLVETIKGAAPVILGIAGPAVIALPAFAAVPFLYAASTTWQIGLSVLLATLFGSLAPFVFLVRRLLPYEQLQWEAALPITARERLVADSATATWWLALLLPLIASSMLIWRLENPRWIWHLWPTVVPLTAVWCVVAFLACLGVLRFRVWQVRHAERGRRPSPRTDARAAKALLAIRQIPGRSSIVSYVIPLFVKPMIRREQAQFGRVLLFLTVVEVMGAWVWFYPAIGMVKASTKGVILSILLVLSFALLDGQMGKHVDALRGTLASYPLRRSSLYRSAFVITIVPTAAAYISAIVSSLKHAAGVSAHIALAYSGALVLSIIGIAVLRSRASKHRPVWLVATTVLLSAIGAYVQ